MKIILSFFGLILLFYSTIQSQTLEDIVRVAESASKVQHPVYQIDNNISSFQIKMEFEESIIQNKTELATIPSANIVAIDLVYTLFPLNKDFTQLNQNRLKALQQIFPTIFEKKNIAWRYVAQTQCKTRKESVALFHGFVVYYQPFEPLQKIKKPNLTLSTKPDNELDEFGSLVFGYPAPKTEISPIILEDLWIAMDTIDVTKSIANILERNTSFLKNSIIVLDWTGSMYEFGLYVLAWLKKNEKLLKEVKVFTAFNDGDDKKSGEKVIGNTGGVYLTESNSIEKIFEIIEKTHEKGHFNNELEENDLEALLLAQYRCPSCQNIILIADSRSPIRDLPLLKNFVNRCKAQRQRLHIVLCGSEDSVMPEYLELALQTNGTLHTIEQDIDLQHISPDATFQLGKNTFSYKEGRFFLVKKKKK